MLAPRSMDPAAHHLHLEPHDYHAPPISRTIQYKKVRYRHSIGGQEVPFCTASRRWQRGQKIPLWILSTPTYHVSCICALGWYYTRVGVFSVLFQFSQCILHVLPTSSSFSFVKKYVTSSLTFFRMYFFIVSLLFFYPEISRMAFCGHGYEPRGL